MSKFCGVCDENLGDSTWDDHNKSWSHLKNVQQKDHTVVLELKGNWHGITQNDIILQFSKFGPIVKINMHTRIIPAMGYAYMEFAKSDVVNKVLSQSFYRIRNHLVKVTRWLTEKQRNAKLELEQKEQRLMEEKEKQYLADVFSTVKLSTTTEDQVKQLSWMLEMPANEKQAAQDLRSDIENIIKLYIPEARVHLIGSAANGLGVRGSDVNLEIELDPNAKRPEAKFLPKPPTLPQTFIKHTEFGVSEGRVTYKSLLGDTKLVDLLWFIYEILNKSPLSLNLARLTMCDGDEMYSRRYRIFFRHLGHQLDCELQVKNLKSVNECVMRLVRLLVSLDPRVRPLYHAVRFWAQQVGPIHQVFSSYGIFLLVYFYLQSTKPPVLPCVDTLSDMCSEEEKAFIRSAQISFCEDVSKIQQQCLTPRNSASLTELLQGFFRFYAKLEMSNRVFCPRSGRSYNMLKFRNMKKVISSLSTFNLKDRCFHVQDVFRTYYNVVLPSLYINKHVVSLEFLRAATIVQGTPDADWHLLSLFPSKPVKDKNVDSLLQKAPVVIPFDPAVLPAGFLAYGSYSEAENQWYQWVVELTMKILQILRIDYQLEGDFGVEDGSGGKRQIKEALLPAKKLKMPEMAAAMQFDKSFEPEWTVVQECTLRCTDDKNLWKGRAKSWRNHWGGDMDSFAEEEKVSLKQLEQSNSTPIHHEFLLLIQHVKTSNESHLEMAAESVGDFYSFLTFMTFFQEFVMKLISKEVGLDPSFLSAKFSQH